MEGKLTITLKDEYKSLAALEDSMKQLFIVAKVTLDDNAEGKDEYETCFIKAEKIPWCSVSKMLELVRRRRISRWIMSKMS